MPILKNITTPAGAAIGFHKLISFKVDATTNIAVASFYSYLDEASYIAKKNIIYNLDIVISTSGFTGDFLTAIQNACVTFGDLAGGTVIIDNGDTILGTQQRKIAELSESCRYQIVSGFNSSALGTLYKYPAKPLDQSNLTGSVLASLLPNNPTNWTTPFWCVDINNVWAFRNHTASQIQLVGQDSKTMLLQALGKNQTLATQVMAAATIAQVAAIIW